MEAESFERKEPRKYEAGCSKDARVEAKNDYGAQQKRNEKEVWVEKKGNKTFAEVVKGAREGRWRGLIVKTLQKSLPWMERSIIGQFKEDLSFEQLGEEFVKGGLNMVRVRYLGDNFALLTPIEGEDMNAIILCHKQWFDSTFYNFKPWTPEFAADHKYVWVRCYGLPLSLWNKDCFTKVLGEETSVVSIDQDTLAWENLEFARLQIRIPQRRSCRWMKNMKINVVMYSIVMEEEMLTYGGGKCKCYSWDSSDSISSSETYVDETSLSVKSCEEVNRQGEGESLWPNWEEADGQTKDRGKLGISMSKVVFKESSTKSRDDKGVSCFSYTKEECRS